METTLKTFITDGKDPKNFPVPTQSSQQILEPKGKNTGIGFTTLNTKVKPDNNLNFGFSSPFDYKESTNNDCLFEDGSSLSLSFSLACTKFNDFGDNTGFNLDTLLDRNSNIGVGQPTQLRPPEKLQK